VASRDSDALAQALRAAMDMGEREYTRRARAARELFEVLSSRSTIESCLRSIMKSTDTP